MTPEERWKAQKQNEKDIKYVEKEIAKLKKLL
jgi:hypothetical protein